MITATNGNNAAIILTAAVLKKMLMLKKDLINHLWGKTSTNQPVVMKAKATGGKKIGNGIIDKNRVAKSELTKL